MKIEISSRQVLDPIDGSETVHMDVGLFSGSKDDPASRFRYRQHAKLLKNKGINIHDYQAKCSQYAPTNKIKRPLWLLNELLHRYKQIIDANSKKFDLYVIQREMIATLCTLEIFVNRPKIFDLDDAVWLRQRFKGVDIILRDVDGVICGNQFIAEYVSQFNKNIFIIPTAVDTTRFYPNPKKDEENVVIGWSGSSSGYENVYEIEESLAVILDRYKNVKLLITSDIPPKFKRISSE
jgi:glycosyltransferase involved in cell wall biosynthesis